MMIRLSIAVGATIAIILLVLSAAPLLISTDIVKAKIATAVREETGRDLRISGSIRLSVLPNLSLAANDVTFSSPSDNFTSDLAQAKSVQGSLEVLSLLRGIIKIHQIQLTEPVFHFEVDKQGHRNWVFHPITATHRVRAPAAGGARLTIAIADLTIVRGTADYFDQRKGTRRLAKDLALKLRVPDFPGHATAQGSATWNGKPIEVALDAASLEKLWEGTSAADLSIRSTPINVDFSGDISGGRHPKATGTIHLEVASAREFLRWLGLQFSAHGTGFGSLSLTATCDASGSRQVLTDAKIAFDSIRARGAMTIDRGDTGPMLTGRLDFASLDFNPYLKRTQGILPHAVLTNDAAISRGGTVERVPAVPTGTGWSKAAIDLTPLRRADAEVQITADAIVFRDTQIGKSAIALRLKNGKLALDLSELTLYGGRGSGEIVADGSGPIPALAAGFDLHGIDAGPLLRDMAGFDQLTGTGDLSISLKGSGRSPQEIVSSLTGDSRIHFANGKVISIGLIKAFKNVFGPLDNGGEIAFETLSATGTIINGLLSNNDLTIVSPKMSLAGSGTIDLPSRSLNYLLMANLATLGSARILVTGPWANPNDKVEAVTIRRGLSPPGKARGARPDR